MEHAGRVVNPVDGEFHVALVVVAIFLFLFFLNPWKEHPLVLL